MTIDLTGKVCLLVGASSGIGYALAEAYLEAGADLCMISSNSRKLKAAEETLRRRSSDDGRGPRMEAIVADIGDPARIDAVCSETRKVFGRIDVLANCVGISVSRTIDDLDFEDWDRVMTVNLRGAFLLSRAAARVMIETGVENGKIINVSSIASKIGEFGNGAYSVSKAGLNNLTQVMAQEYGPHGISVTAVCPGYTDTELLREALSTRAPLEGMTPEAYTDQLISSVPLGRMARPREIADFILFLSSDKANYISGVALTIAGGKMLL